ncbi:hypothetical protein DFH11DRAFT_828383 [Phellopilus nigrolimitatus]|nr:hypothetical protein DFH11DRAFT_828383 [Phellopilus nigrolimitatus]
MFRSLLVSALALAFAGRVMALQIALGSPLGNITATQMLAVPAGPYVDACASMCNPVNSTIASCGDANDACVCTNDVAAQLVQCEQCMLNSLVALNMKQPDPRVGTNVGLTAFATACTASLGLTLSPAPMLAIAAGWDGPTDIVLNLGATVVVVGFGAVLGSSALFMLSSI